MKIKTLISAILLFSAIMVSAQTTIKLGDNVQGVIDEEILTISGTGEMQNFSYMSSSWFGNIKEVIIEEGVTSIGECAFYGCSSLTTITIGNSVTSIGNEAFYNCSSLTSIFIPKTVTSIGGAVFGGCSKLTEINVDSDNVAYSSENGILFNKDKTIIVRYPAGKIENTYTIPNSVTNIGNSAFEFCGHLISITIPNSVTNIGDGAFHTCSGLTSVTIPNSVASTGRRAFYNCRNATLYCECEETSKPSGWESSWDTRTKWGCKVIRKGMAMGGFFSIEGTNYAVKCDDGSLWYLTETTNGTVTLKATKAANGYHIKNVRWNDVGVGSPLTINVTESKTYTATFEAHVEVEDDAIAATCTADGKTAGKHCSVCNAVTRSQITIPATGHTYSNTITVPTCMEIGYTTHTCSVCEHTYYSDTIDAKGHKADSVEFENIIPATCTAAGSKDSVVFCSVCQAELSREKKAIAALGHSYSNIVTAPTCTAVGYTTHTCSVCEHTYNSDTIAATGHTEVTDAAVPATCTAAGKTEGKHCSVCNETIVAQTEIPALGHEFKDYVYNNDATTTADGTETATCTRGCGATDTRAAAGTKLAETPEKGTAVAESAANAVTIYAHHNTIVVENATEEISIYNAMGTLICRDATPCVRTEINVNAPGIYIVKTGSVVKRVMVNQ